MMKRFPKTVYVKYEESDKDPYLLVADDPTDLAEMSAHVRVGIYELKELAFISADPVITGRKKK